MITLCKTFHKHILPTSGNILTSVVQKGAETEDASHLAIQQFGHIINNISIYSSSICTYLVLTVLVIVDRTLVTGCTPDGKKGIQMHYTLGRFPFLFASWFCGIWFWSSFPSLSLMLYYLLTLNPWLAPGLRPLKSIMGPTCVAPKVASCFNEVFQMIHVIFVFKGAILT